MFSLRFLDLWSRLLQLPESAASNATLYSCEIERFVDQMAKNTENFAGKPERRILRHHNLK